MGTEKEVKVVGPFCPGWSRSLQVALPPGFPPTHTRKPNPPAGMDAWLEDKFLRWATEDGRVCP